MGLFGQSALSSTLAPRTRIKIVLQKNFGIFWISNSHCCELCLCLDENKNNKKEKKLISTLFININICFYLMKFSASDSINIKKYKQCF